MTEYDAVLLAGGRASRLGGVDKPALLVGGMTLLDRVLAAVTPAGRRIVVGPEVDGGPVAAIAAGVVQVRAAIVVVLASDLPFLTTSTVDSLIAAVTGGCDAAVLVDNAGHDQLLIAAWRTEALRARLAAIGDPAGQPVRRLLDAVTLARVSVQPAPGQPPPWLDCDTDDDLRRARDWT